jgi:8-oxo-dGTP diphosphatase
MKNYVVGFLFSPDSSYVVLIQKLKPDWQRGKLNGVGGLIEEGETPHEAMVREFREETGYEFRDWKSFLTMDILVPEQVRLFFFRGRLSNETNATDIRSVTDEQVSWFATAGLQFLGSDRIIPNLKWLIPLARSGDSGRIEMYE